MEGPLSLEIIEQIDYKAIVERILVLTS
jgi:hypothetical protein